MDEKIVLSTKREPLHGETDANRQRYRTVPRIASDALWPGSSAAAV